MASLATGTVLSLLHVGPDELLAAVGLTREAAADLFARGWAWAMPNMLLGSAVILPIWFIMVLITPPRVRD